MPCRNQFIRKIQSLSADEATRQPSAADWLWEQDKAGRTRVNPLDDAEIALWATALDATPGEVAHAIETVGTGADAIRAHLRKKP